MVSVTNFGKFLAIISSALFSLFFLLLELQLHVLDHLILSNQSWMLCSVFVVVVVVVVVFTLLSLCFQFE